MKNTKLFSCNGPLFAYKMIAFFCAIIMVALPTYAKFDRSRNKDYERRLNRIYKQSYDQTILANTWAEFLKSIEQENYVVQKGDTLWGVSQVFFGDGNYWSKLWSVNGIITNPHKIDVGDTVFFRAQSFINNPEWMQQGDSAQLQELLSSNEGGIELGDTIGQTQQIPSVFEEDIVAQGPVQRADSVVIEGRPRMAITTKTLLDQEILSRRPEYIGSVTSVGDDRVISGQLDTVFVYANKEAFSEGAVLSLVNVEEADDGYSVQYVAKVNVVEGLRRDIYRLNVIEQLGKILPEKTKVIARLPKLVDLTINSQPRRVEAEVVNHDGRTMWTRGHFVYLKAKDNEEFSVGDIIYAKNYYSEDYNSFYFTGTLKIVSVSDEFATAAVLHSAHPVSQESVVGKATLDR